MNIVLISESYLPYISGISSSTHSIARALADAGHNVTVIAPKSAQLDPTVEHEPGITVLRTWSVPDPNYIGRMITPFPLLITEVDKAITPKTDIVHVQEPTSIGLSAYVRARHVGVPVVGALHFTPDQIMRMVPWFPYNWGVSLVKAYIRWRYNKYDAIMVPTQTFVDFLKSIGVSAPTIVISNGVDIKKFTPTDKKTEVRSKLGWPAHRVIFLILSRLDKDKFVDDAVRALPKADKNVHLVVAGVGPEEVKLHALAEELQVTDRITWVGKVGESEMINLYRASDGFVMMGIYEVQSIVTLQAVASGLPVIAARAGALPELCHDGENGYLVTPHDSATVAEKLSLLARDENVRRKMGIKSRTISLAHDKAKAMKRVETWYRTVIEKQKKTG